MTYTRVHTHVTFADPFLVCDECRNRVTGFHDPEHCGCTGDFHLLPCNHVAEPVSTCPSWSPVDGCRCQEHLGHVPHARPVGPAPDNGGGGDW